MTANWRKCGKGEDKLKTVFCLSLGRAGTLELYFPFFSITHCFYLLRSLHHPFPLSPLLSLPPSLALWDIFKVKPFGQSASCKDLHRCFPFLSLLACVCNLSSVRARVSKLNILSWPHIEQHTHSHTNSDQASSRVVFKNPLHSPWGTEALCTHRCCVCVECIHKLASLPLFQLYLQCFRRAVVFLPCTGIFCEEVYGNATSQQHSHRLIIQPLSDFNR